MLRHRLSMLCKQSVNLSHYEDHPFLSVFSLYAQNQYWCVQYHNLDMSYRTCGDNHCLNQGRGAFLSLKGSSSVPD
jgi:hypothetical protein